MHARKAEPEDRDRVIELAQEFASLGEATITTQVIRDNAEKIFQSVIDNLGMVCIVIGRPVYGFIIACETVVPGTNDRIMQEMAWYVTPDKRAQGMKLMVALEQECYRRGIDKIVMVALANEFGDRIGTMYKRMGYRELERHYIKEI